MNRTVRVLVVDDSSIVRQILKNGLSAEEGIEVVATAADAYEARDKIVELNPDVMTLDIEMPRMKGIDFLKRLIPQFPMPVVMVSALTAPGAEATLEALEYGAVDFVLKPTTGGAHLVEMIGGLAEKIRTAANARVIARSPGSSRSGTSHVGEPRRWTGKHQLLAIGASTGGTVALKRMLEEFPADMPGTVVVQHMPPVFTRMFAERLDTLPGITAKEAEDGDVVARGTVLIAPGDKHMEVIRHNGLYQVRCRDGEKVNGHRPSVGVLMESVAKNVGPKAIGVVLTGMGRDGASALLDMRNAGARTLAQDAESSAVFGMPKEAWECGGAERLVHIDDMTRELVGILEGNL
jgi:two-component system, chemotaxis family, protein-glutamate methylesterase/glutaminase